MERKGRCDRCLTRFPADRKVFVIIGVLLVAAIIGLSLSLHFFKEKQVIGAVVSNAKECAKIGRQMLNTGGSAVDAAIAILLCDGVMMPDCLGLGGGFVATIYKKETGKIETLIARAAAPLAANETMFVGQRKSAKAIAVPGELLGYHELHKKYGSLSWETLFQPSIKFCKSGQNVSEYISNKINSKIKNIINEPTLATVFLKEDNKPYLKGEILKRPKLASTLEIIAKKGIKEFYNGGHLGKMFIKDIQEMGGIITEKDLKDYRVRWENESHITANITAGYKLYTTPLPSSGIVLAFIFNVLENLYINNHEIYWHRIVETFKHAFGQHTNLGDFEKDIEMNQTIQETLNNLKNPNFIKLIRSLIFDNKTFENFEYYGAKFEDFKDYGTANVVVLAPNGDAISVTSTINNHFGAFILSRRTGIMLNNEMDGFSTPGFVSSYGYPASLANYIKPGKMPMSSMCPSIILDKNGNVRLLVGGAGGSHIPTSVAITIIKYLILNETLKEAIDGWRLHHQLYPSQILFEFQTPENLKTFLKNEGHNVSGVSVLSSHVTAIGVRNGIIEPYCGRRRFGSTDTILR